MQPESPRTAAQPARRPAAAAAAAAAAVVVIALALSASRASASDLALERIVLSLGGVGYFEYGADIDAPATLGLDLRRDQVSDMLMSLVVWDSGATVASAELPGDDPATAAFAQLPFGRDALADPVRLLNGLQGAEVEAHGPALPNGSLRGRIVQAVRVTEPIAASATGGATVAAPRTRLVLLTSAGLQEFVVEDAIAIAPADPGLQASLNTALAALYTDAGAQADRQRRRLTLHLAGAGRQRVRVGMVLAAPLWKTSYRLLLPSRDQQPGAAARLQAWATFENDSATDWNGIAVTFQAGNPVTFRQALYRIIHVDRPELPVQVQNRPLSPVDTGAMPMSRLFAAPAALASPAPAPPVAPASTDEGATATTFALPAPVTLPAGHTATVPILDREVPATRLFLLDAGQRHPLATLEVTNATGASLPPGAVATFDDGNFVGDARLAAVPAGAKRLLSFAEDLRTTAQWDTADSATVIGIAASGGVLRLMHRQRTTTTATIEAPSGESRDLRVSFPRQEGKTISVEPPSPIEQTETAWRVSLAVGAGEHRVLVAHVDSTDSESIVIADHPDALLAVLNEPGLGPAAREAVQHVAALQQALVEASAVRDRLAGERATIEQDESRLRSNLAVIPTGEALHARLVQALGADEDRLAELAPRLAQARAAAERARQAVSDAIAALIL